jgi:hypothetical protein
MLVHPFVGSGLTCEGIGFGCTPERFTDSVLVAAVFGVAAYVTLVVAAWRERRGRTWHRQLAAGMALTLVLTAATAWSQLPRHPTSPGPLSAAREHMDRVLADGIAVAPRGTALGDALRELAPQGPLPCRDAYGRDTGARAFRWTGPGADVVPSGASGAITAAALGSWAARLRARGVAATITDPGGDPTSDRRLAVGSTGPTGGGSVYVRSSFYISQLEIRAATGCHAG